MAEGREGGGVKEWNCLCWPVSVTQETKCLECSESHTRTCTNAKIQYTTYHITYTIHFLTSIPMSTIDFMSFICSKCSSTSGVTIEKDVFEKIWSLNELVFISSTVQPNSSCSKEKKTHLDEDYRQARSTISVALNFQINLKQL